MLVRQGTHMTIATSRLGRGPLYALQPACSLMLIPTRGLRPDQTSAGLLVWARTVGDHSRKRTNRSDSSITVSARHHLISGAVLLLVKTEPPTANQVFCRQAAVPMQQGAGLLGLPMLNARSLFGAEQPFEERDQYGFDAFG